MSELTIADFMVPHLRANVHMFLPHTPATPDDIRASLNLVSGCPVWAAVNANATAPEVVVSIYGRHVPTPAMDLARAEFFPARLQITPDDVRATDGGNFARIALGLDDATDYGREQLKVVRKSVPKEGLTIPGCALRLPPYVSRMQAAWEAKVAGKSYGIESFYGDVIDDLSQVIGSLIDHHVMSQQLPGLQAQADSDIRLLRFPAGGRAAPIAEVGLAPADAERFREIYARRYRTPVATIAGLHTLLLRYPAAGPKSAGWTRLQILPDRLPGKIYVDPISWDTLQDGDTDGDLAYLMVACQFFGMPRTVEKFPRLVLNPAKLAAASRK